jgi:hypothetical protein
MKLADFNVLSGKNIKRLKFSARKRKSEWSCVIRIFEDETFGYVGLIFGKNTTFGFR